ncbi:MAG: citrate transporter [Lachnospiraceae bacterium]|nr:citrate transporter [Lachnospiraceae bacterium]
MQKLIDFVKKEVVLVVAVVLALVSMLFVTPDTEYLDYIDFRTLSILFCLMAVMAGLQQMGVFREIAEALLKKVHKIWQLVLILVMLCFFFSMLITNDVALITFVPFTFIILELLGEDVSKKLMIPVVVMQTIAANLGSMFTPIGNPQNIYLHGISGMNIGSFLLLMLPYTLVSFVLLAVYCLYLGKKCEKGDASASLQAFQDMTERTHLQGGTRDIVRYLLLFALSLMTVAGRIPYLVTLGIVLVVLVIFDRKLFAKIDYALLMTFVGFFVFIGNMGRVAVFRDFLQGMMEGNEVMTAVVSSQVISNVPAALLLSGFTNNYEALIVGTNLGGLGTLIASMASLISYKYVVKENKCSKGAYFGFFTVANVVFLVILLLIYKMEV